MTTILSEIISLLVGGITGVAEGIGSGLSTLARDIFTTYTTAEGGAVTITGLSTFGSLIIIFAGISLAIGLGRWVVNFCTSLGSRNS